jgi:hypothetical protein
MIGRRRSTCEGPEWSGASKPAGITLIKYIICLNKLSIVFSVLSYFEIADNKFSKSKVSCNQIRNSLFDKTFLLLFFYKLRTVINANNNILRQSILIVLKKNFSKFGQ